MKSLLLVFLGGGIGSSLRFGVDRYLNPVLVGFPYGTFAVNILGSLFIGLILGWAARNNSISHNTLFLLVAGFCGGFTTFSSFAYENYLFLRDGNMGLFAVYTLASLVIGFGAVFLGIWLVKFI
ncbi:MAG: fluoride efflux transporter CrcB [Bacteroidia bacterium]|nr:fluoride efflux transporter CrcB [Bacteroidia bacterium]NNM23139.1 fluoride efflux transporter CrcB [Flavobacteriaceae bacterium]